MSIDWSTPPQLLLVALSIPAPTISIPQQLASTRYNNNNKVPNVSGRLLISCTCSS
jgi:hypothetical protein